jgi:drug/metabolite transporter (DMT)-like permease
MYEETAIISKHQVFIFLLIAFTTGGPAIFLYYYGLKRISASVATICELSFPLTSVILEYILRGNLLSPLQWFGVLVLFGSILKVTRMKPVAAEESAHKKKADHLSH